MEDPDFQSRLLDTFVARVEVKNGEARVFFNISGEGSVTITKVDQTGVEPVSKSPFPVLLLSYSIIVEYSSFPYTSGGRHPAVLSSL